jgi:excisionase family DNA binding protein
VPQQCCSLEWLDTLSREQLPAAALHVSSILCAISARLTESDGKSVSASNGTLVDAVEMAKLLDVPTSWVRSAARSGRIPSQKIGRYIRFAPGDVAAARKVQP